MSPQLQNIEEQALRLPSKEREALVESLLQSLRQEASTTAIESAWAEEADRRYQEYQEGRVEGIPAEQVFADIQEEFGWSS